MKKKTQVQRDERIVEDYENGLKMAEIIKIYGITRQRVYQILSEKNVKKRNKFDKKNNQ